MARPISTDIPSFGADVGCLFRRILEVFVEPSLHHLDLFALLQMLEVPGRIAVRMVHRPVGPALKFIHSDHLPFG